MAKENFKLPPLPLKLYPEKKDGEPASEWELNRMRGLKGEEGFVPEDPKQASEYYERQRMDILSRGGIENTEKVELFRYYNGKLLEILANNPKIAAERGKKVEELNPEGKLAHKFEDLFKDRLLETLNSDHYVLVPNESEISPSQSFEKEFLGYSFCLVVTSAQEDSGSGISEYKFNLKDNNTNKDFMGKIVININNDDIKMTLLPSISVDQKENFNTDYVPQTPEKVKSLMGLTYLLRRPVFDNKLYEGGRAPGLEEPENGEMITDVGKERKEVMVPFRRRTVDNPDSTWEQAQDLVSSLSPENGESLRDSSGSYSFNVHYINFSNNQNDRWSDTFNSHIESAGYIGICSNERAQLESLVSRAMDMGGKAVISVNGCWVPPELENEQQGGAKRPHLRRGINRVILVLGRDFDNEEYTRIKESFIKKSKGENISEDDSQELNDFLSRYNINNPFKVSFEKVDGVHFANGTWHSNPKHGERKKYTIRPAAMNSR